MRNLGALGHALPHADMLKTNVLADTLDDASHGGANLVSDANIAQTLY